MIFRYFILFSLFALGYLPTSFAQLERCEDILSQAEALLFEDTDKSIALSKAVLVQADSLGNKNLRAVALKNKGLGEYVKGDFEAAILSFDAACRIFEQLNDLMGMSACYNGLAISYRDMGLFSQALGLFEKALAIDYRLNDIKGLAVIYNNLGMMYHMQERAVLAIAYYVKSLHFEKLLNNTTGMGDSYLNIAAILEENNMYAQSLRNLEHAVRLYEQEGNAYRLGYVYNNMGRLLMGLQRFYPAIDSFNKSLAYKESTSDIAGKVTTLLNLGEAFIVLGDTLAAKRMFKEALWLDMELTDAGNTSVSPENRLKDFSMDDYLFYFVSSSDDEADLYTMSERLFYRGYICFVLSEFENAVPFFLNSLELAEFQENNHICRLNYYYLFKTFYHLADYKAASKFAEKLATLNDRSRDVFFGDYFELLQKVSGIDLFSSSQADMCNEDSHRSTSGVWFFISILLAVIVVIQFKVRKR